MKIGNLEFIFHLSFNMDILRSLAPRSAHINFCICLETLLSWDAGGIQTFGKGGQVTILVVRTKM